MKIYKKYITDGWKRFLAIMFSIALITPATVMSHPSPATVNLGTAGNFVILAKTGVSTTGTTSIVGNIGISPAAATYITGFGLIMDVSNTFSTSSLVTGKIYAADYTDPTPANMTTAVGDMETAYTDAAGRTSPDYTELYAGDITGQTLSPGLYKWSTGVLVSAAGVTISGNASDVWIFQIAQNLELANGAIVTLSGGAKASNIFWQVAGQVTIGTTVAMKGIILCQTTIAMNTGATLVGRALTQTAVTSDADIVTKPSEVVDIKNRSTQQNFLLRQNYKKRFIEFTVPSKGNATLIILNTLGQNIATLFNGDVAAEKKYHVQFDMSMLTKGIYFLKLEFNGKIKLEKIYLIN
jgi:hypothetical protein